MYVLQESRSFYLLDSRKGRTLAAAAVVLASLAVYSNTLYNGFVYDDTHVIVGNPWIRDFNSVRLFFTTDAWAFSRTLFGYYRPLVNIIFTLEYSLFGLNAWGYHLVNMLFHAGVSVLVFTMVLDLLGKYRPGFSNTLPALVAALLFAVHPIHTEPVNWVSDITDLSCAFFCLLALKLYMNADTRGDYKFSLSFSVFFFFAAALCKETALTVLAAFVAYDLLIGKAPDVKSVKRYIPYALAVIAYAAMRINALGRLLPVKQGFEEGKDYYYPINALNLFCEYVLKLLVPVNLKGYYTFHPAFSFFETRVLLSTMLAATVAALAVLLYRYNRLALFGLVFFAVLLLPALYIYGLGGSVFGERYLYLPSAGFAVCIAAAAGASIDKPGRALPLLVAFFFVAALYSAVTVARNRVWKDELTFWTDTARKSPDAALPHYNLASALFAAKRTDEAIEQYKAAISSDPGYLQAHNNLGVVYMSKGMTDEAVVEYKKALELDPDHVSSHYNLGIAYAAKGMTDQAVLEYKKAMELEPGYRDAQERLEAIYKAEGRAGSR